MGGMEAVLKTFFRVAAAEVCHYPAPFLAKIGKVLGSHTGFSEMDMVGAEKFSCTVPDIICQIGIIDQHGIPFGSLNR